MSLKDFLDKRGVENIAPKFISVMDSVVEPRIRASFGFPPLPPSIPLVLLDIPIILETPPIALPVAIAFFTTLTLDIMTLLIIPLTAGSVLLLSPVAMGIPIPAPLISTITPLVIPFGVNPNFGNAILEWVVSLLPVPELRLAGVVPTVL